MVTKAEHKTCPRCDAIIKPKMNLCTSCGYWCVSDAPTIGPADEEDGSILLEDIVSSDADRMMTGPWDICFGRLENENDDGPPGIVRGSTNLIGGSPGAGKSTLFLQICRGVIVNYQLPVLYLSAEEQLPQIKARADRMKITGNRLMRFVDLRKGNASLARILTRYKFGLLILDSVKALAETEEGAIEICKIIKEFATQQHAPALLSQHVTKEGAVAGLMALQHEVDGTYTFFPDTDRIDPVSGEAPRILETQKNRNGRAFVSAEFTMTKLGLVYIEPENDDDEDDNDDEEAA